MKTLCMHVAFKSHQFHIEAWKTHRNCFKGIENDQTNSISYSVNSLLSQGCILVKFRGLSLVCHSFYSYFDVTSPFHYQWG